MQPSRWRVTALMDISTEVRSPRTCKKREIRMRSSGSPHPVQTESQQERDAPIDPCAASLLTAAKRILEMIAAGASLTDILTNLCTAINPTNPELVSIVMVMDPALPPM